MKQISNLTNLNWLITGGCGFVGRMVIGELLNRGVKAGRIRVLDNFSGSDADDLRLVVPVSIGMQSYDTGHNSCALVEGDIRTDKDAMDAAKDADVIIHLAACTGIVPAMKDPRFDCDTNVVGTLNMLEAARHNGVKKFVFASSSAPLGVVDPPVHENLAGRPSSPYGASKLAGEAYCSAYFHAYGVETVALRFGNLYGPFSGHKTSIVANFINRALNGETMQIYGDGTVTRDYIYGPDLVDAICLAVSTEGVGGEIFQISTARETSVSEVADVVKQSLEDRKIDNVRIEKTEPRFGDIQRNFADTSKAREMLGWTAQTELKNGIGATIDWFIEQRT